MPDQAAIDSVAHYSEAAIELRLSTFLDEDTHQATLTTSGGEFSAHLADDHVLSNFLFPFRRIWMQKEPSNFARVRNVLVRNAAEGPTQNLLTYCHTEHKRTCSTWFPHPIVPYGLSPQGVVDLMLNTRYAHAGAKQKGKLSRVDLERYQQSIGAETLEWLFHTTLQSLSLTFISMGDIAVSALDHWARTGLGRPSFKLNIPAPLVGLEIEIKPPSKITRVTPGWTPEVESDKQRVGRYLRRRRFVNLVRLLELLSIPKDRLFQLICTAKNADDLIELVGVKTEHFTGWSRVEDIQNVIAHGSTFLCMQTGEKGHLAITIKGVLQTDEHALAIVDRELIALQKLLSDSEPLRLWTNDPRRFCWQSPGAVV